MGAARLVLSSYMVVQQVALRRVFKQFICSRIVGVDMRLVVSLACLIGSDMCQAHGRLQLGVLSTCRKCCGVIVRWLMFQNDRRWVCKRPFSDMQLLFVSTPMSWVIEERGIDLVMLQEGNDCLPQIQPHSRQTWRRADLLACFFWSVPVPIRI